ncbi:hypothetical protein BC829DRAFT_303134 [Chytridium lagenaria]|nr:hypothetical protein BC829DRAFT_303134 [Chytridium lagenaria]
MRTDAGVLEWRPEIISDLRVINAYLRQRKLIESQIADSEANQGQNDDDLKKQRKKKTQDQIIKLKQTSQSKKSKKKKDEDKPTASSSSDKPFKLKIPLMGMGSQKRKRSEQFESALASLESIISTIVKDRPDLALSLQSSATSRKPVSLLEIGENCKNLVYYSKEEIQKDLETLISGFASEMGHNSAIASDLKIVMGQLLEFLDAEDS